MDDLEADLASLKAMPDQNRSINAATLSGLCAACGELFGYWSAYSTDLSTILRVPPKLVNSFVRNFDEVRVGDATILAAKMLSYLKSIEGQVAADELVRTQAITESVSVQETVPPSSSLRISASQWASVPELDQIKSSILQVSILLDSIVMLARSTNLPQNQRSLSEIERAELIAILETAIHVLKAPMLEKSLLQKVGKSLGRSAKNIAENQAESALGQLAEEGRKAIFDLVSKFPWGG